MKTNTKNNTIASIILAAAPVAPLAYLLPTGEAVIGSLVIAALTGLGYMELRNGAAANVRRHPKGSIQLYRNAKSQA